MARNTRTFTDLDLNFLSHPRTEDVTVKYDEEAIKQSIKNLVMTRNYERPFRSDIGCQVMTLLFEPASPILVDLLEKTITDTIINYEPRVDLMKVIVLYNEAALSVNVDIVFRIKNTQTPVSVNIILERTR